MVRNKMDFIQSTKNEFSDMPSDIQPGRSGNSIKYPPPSAFERGRIVNR